ncbi:MAG: hypothetical protein LBJ10_08540 [Clostridiales bacterium]|nr:hypothetical protein [Clostridiales bacterium]
MGMNLSKRKLRRKALARILLQLRQIRDAEESYCGSIPDSAACEDQLIEASHASSMLSDAIDTLDMAY